VYKPLLGLCQSGKSLGIFQRSFVPLMVRAITRNGSYTSTLGDIIKQRYDEKETKNLSELT
jgi:hypothetical protein